MGTKEPTTKVFSARLPAELAVALENLALSRGIKPSRLIALMLDDHFNKKAQIDFQEMLVEFVRCQQRRDTQIEQKLKNLDSRLADFGALLRDAIAID